MIMQLNASLVAVAVLSALASTADATASIDNTAAPDAKALRQLQKQYGDGPYPHEIDAYLSDKPEGLRPLYSSLFVEGTRNAVLNNLRIGVAAMEIGEFPRAEQAFDDALAQIETIYADDPRAKQARSVWSREAVKDFKGEPYERAMAYYYRGLLYLRTGDYENARASFLQGEYQSTLSEAEEYASAFPLLDYLAGWATQCAGNDAKAQEFFATAQKEALGLAVPAQVNNLLVVAELGKAPVKYAGGKANELLQFKQADGVVAQQVSLTVSGPQGSGTTLAAAEGASVSWQAMHRGGRAVQSVLNGKVQFKDTMGTVGEAGSTVGMLAMNLGVAGDNSDLAGAGALVGLAGLAFSAMSNAAKPDADTRAWDNLPDSIHFATTVRPDGEWSITTSVPTATPAARLDDGAGRCSIAWVRGESATAVTASAPGTTLKASEARKLQRKFSDQDKAFRSALLSQNF